VVVVAGSLDSNEPIGTVLDAARLIPHVEIRCTGDLNRVPAAMVSSAPPNVRFTGWLDYGRFLGELQRADVVAAFSDDPEIMNRAAFEAVGLGCALVLSDLPKLRGRFGQAARFTANTPGAMAQALLDALDEREQLAARSRALRDALEADHTRALAALRRLLAPKTEASAESVPQVEHPRVLVVSAHPYPSHPLLRRNVDYLLERGVAVDLLCTRDERLGPVPARAGLRIRALPVKHQRGRVLSYLIEYLSFFLMAFPIVTAWSLRRRPDVVQVDNLPDFLVFAAVVPRLLGSRVVLYIYDLFPEMTMTRLNAPPDHAAVRLACFLERSSARFAHHVITVSECFRDLLATRGLDRKRVSVLYNSQPVPTGLLRVRPRSAVMITHASLVERYGLQVAIRALPDLVTKWPDITYEVLGDGEYFPVLRDLAARLGVSDHVRFRGFRPWRETMEQIGRASVGVVPVIADGFGELILPMKLLEYAGVGIPIVCSRLPGIEEGFPPDAVAYFAQGDAAGLAQQVDRLLRSPHQADLQVTRARDALQRLAWETVSPGYLRTLAPV
jgi:glycosyltransferase involved in cell wall biosynthesis